MRWPEGRQAHHDERQHRSPSDHRHGINSLSREGRTETSPPKDWNRSGETSY
jgi:hypothetical protein